MIQETSNIVLDHRLDEEIFRLQKLDLEPNMRQMIERATQVLAEGRHLEAAALVEKAEAMRRAAAGSSSRLHDAPIPESAGSSDNGRDLALAPVAEKLGYGMARIFALALRDLEDHIAGETRKIGDAVGRRLDTLQASIQDVATAVSEQQSIGRSVQEKCDQLAAATASLREQDTRHEAQLTALRNETRDLSASVSERIDALSRDLGVQQEDLGAVKSTLCNISSRVDALVDRLDRQAEAIRSMCATSAQHETELDQLMESLTKLRASRTPLPANRL